MSVYRVALVQPWQHELKLQQERFEREATALNEKHQEDMLKERRLFEATKIQLAHQVGCPASHGFITSIPSVLCMTPGVLDFGERFWLALMQRRAA